MDEMTVPMTMSPNSRYLDQDLERVVIFWTMWLERSWFFGVIGGCGGDGKGVANAHVWPFGLEFSQDMCKCRYGKITHLGHFDILSGSRIIEIRLLHCGSWFHPELPHFDADFVSFWNFVLAKSCLSSFPLRPIGVLPPRFIQNNSSFCRLLNYNTSVYVEICRHVTCLYTLYSVYCLFYTVCILYNCYGQFFLAA